jgi:hypothetical protein
LKLKHTREKLTLFSVLKQGAKAFAPTGDTEEFKIGKEEKKKVFSPTAYVPNKYFNGNNNFMVATMPDVR